MGYTMQRSRSDFNTPFDRARYLDNKIEKLVNPKH